MKCIVESLKLPRLKPSRGRPRTDNKTIFQIQLGLAFRRQHARRLQRLLLLQRLQETRNNEVRTGIWPNTLPNRAGRHHQRNKLPVQHEIQRNGFQCR